MLTHKHTHIYIYIYIYGAVEHHIPVEYLIIVVFKEEFISEITCSSLPYIKLFMYFIFYLSMSVECVHCRMTSQCNIKNIFI